MTIAFLDDEFDQSEVFEITQDDIEGCTDIIQLSDWHKLIVEVKDDIHADLSARVATDRATDVWTYRVSRKLMFLGKGESRIRRRLKVLGHDPIWESEQVNSLKRSLALAKAEASFGREYIAAAEGLLSPDYHQEIYRRAMAKLEAISAAKKEAA